VVDALACLSTLAQQTCRLRDEGRLYCDDAQAVLTVVRELDEVLGVLPNG
jgi:hypothetical protein